MGFVVIYLVLSVVGLIASFPLAYINNIPYLTIITDYFASLTLCGCLCGFFTLFFRFFFKKYYNVDAKIFKVSDKEIRFYEFIKIDKLKKLIPDWGNLVGFKKQVDMKQATDPDFYYRFLFENINASYLHFFSILISPMVFLILNPTFYISLGLPIVLIVFILDILPVMLQRYLRPKLYSLYVMSKRRQERELKKKEAQKD